MLVNQPVTNIISKQNKLVGTSETIRSLSSINSAFPDLYWNQWLAGLIDGDGSLLVSKAGYSSCEITMGIKDEIALSQIKQKLGGSIKLRSGVKAIRYRLHHKQGMINLIERINGHIRHSARLIQLKKVCSLLNINFIEPSLISIDNGWFTGFFDADGTINYSIKNGYPQLTISVSNKLDINIQCFKQIFGGNIYYDNSGSGYFKWSIQSKAEIENFVDYLKKFPSRSHKRQRIFLVPQFFDLKNIKAYSAPVGSIYNKIWIKFEDKWNKRG